MLDRPRAASNLVVRTGLALHMHAHMVVSIAEVAAAAGAQDPLRGWVAMLQGWLLALRGVPVYYFLILKGLLVKGDDEAQAIEDRGVEEAAGCMATHPG